MQKVKIPKKINHDTVEQLIAALNSNGNDTTDLEVPIDVSYRGFGILSSLFLLLFKWMRGNPGKLIIAVNEDQVDDIEQFATSYFGYVFLLTAWPTTTIVDLKGKNLKPKLREFTSVMYEKIDFLQDLPNNEVLLPCFDHYSNERGLNHWLYPDQIVFANTPSNLQNTVYRVFETVGKIYKSRFNNVISEIFDDIEIILWELLRNTDEHAKTDYLNVINLYPNTRGVYFKISQSSKDNFLSNAKNSTSLINYYEKAMQEGNNFIFEISVFDSGPGLARRYCGEKWEDGISVDEEVDIVKMCLAKGASSVLNWGGKLKGYGLNDVLELLSKRNGFLKIRSGRTSICRDLINKPHIATANFSEIELNDWKSDKSSLFTEMPFAEGTSLTMAFPLPKIDAL